MSSDDSDDSDGALGTGLSLDSSTQHTALTMKSEPCEQGDALAEGKPLNGVLLQGKGKVHIVRVISMLFTHYYTCTAHWCHITVYGRYHSCTFLPCDVSSLC